MKTLKSVEDVGFEMGWEKGWDEGWDEGWKQSGIEFAKNLILNGRLSKKEIAMHTGLNLREINKLENEINREKSEPSSP